MKIFNRLQTKVNLTISFSLPGISYQAPDPKSGKKRSLFAQQFESTPPVNFGVTLGPPVRAAITSHDLGDKDVVSMETEGTKTY